MMQLYHGSDTEILTVDLSYSRVNKDFGRGFYLSDDLNQAWCFARYKASKRTSESKKAIVTEFSLDEKCLSDGSLRVLRFDGYSLEWVSFIKANRQTRNEDYDVVVGPIANDDVRTQFGKRFLYVLNNMEVLDRLPKELNNQLFQRMKEIASLSNLSADQMIAYHRSMMEDYAYYDTINTTYKKGRKEGREEGIAEGEAKGRKEQAIEMARSLKEDGFDPAAIAKASKLSVEEIAAL